MSPEADVLQSAVLPGGRFEVWSRGRGGPAVVMPRIRPEYSPRLRRALERRRDANLDGRCACGGAIAGGAALAPGLGSSAIVHEPRCDAGDRRLERLFAAEGRRP